MAEDQTATILDAIKEQGDRHERALLSLASEIRDMGQAIVKGFAHENTKPVTNGGGYWPVATFSIVIISLGTMFLGSQSWMDEKVAILDKHQKERVESLDTLLQKEIGAAHTELQATATQQVQFVSDKFDTAESDSAKRHDEQQKQIDEVKGFFKAPALRNNGNK